MSLRLAQYDFQMGPRKVRARPRSLRRSSYQRVGVESYNTYFTWNVRQLPHIQQGDVFSKPETRTGFFQQNLSEPCYTSDTAHELLAACHKRMVNILTKAKTTPMDHKIRLAPSQSDSSSIGVYPTPFGSGSLGRHPKHARRPLQSNYDSNLSIMLLSLVLLSCLFQDEDVIQYQNRRNISYEAMLKEIPSIAHIEGENQKDELIIGFLAKRQLLIDRNAWGRKPVGAEDENICRH